jgi:hypothetical protein
MLLSRSRKKPKHLAGAEAEADADICNFWLRVELKGTVLRDLTGVESGYQSTGIPLRMSCWIFI